MKFDYPEGATPLLDESGLIPKWIHNQGQLNRAEAENVFHALSLYCDGRIRSPVFWLDVHFFRKVHKAMFCDVWDWAGAFRSHQTLPGVAPYKIMTELSKLCEETKFWLAGEVELTILEQAARLHHQLVFIHPFSNGNGRFARLIADRFLRGFKIKPPQWPKDLGDSSDRRHQYLKALKEYKDTTFLTSLLKASERRGEKSEL